jgi:hypothetical protein
VERSHNGWIASPNPAEINVERFRVPDIRPRVYLAVRREVAPVLLNVAKRFHKRVDRLNNPVHDDGGYNYRTIAGSSFLSNHASGTAIDLNWSRYPMGRRNMNAEQRRECQKIVERYKVIRWGGAWAGSSVDEMHFEIAPGVSLNEVREVIGDLRLTVNGESRRR